MLTTGFLTDGWDSMAMAWRGPQTPRQTVRGMSCEAPTGGARDGRLPAGLPLKKPWLVFLDSSRRSHHQYRV